MNRTVCRYWRNLIESRYNIYMEINNYNWEALMSNSTAARIHLNMDNLLWPIYKSPRFPDFASRLRILEFYGYVPTYNFINIFKGCKRLDSLVIARLTMDSIQTPANSSGTEGSVLHLKKLSIGHPGSWPRPDTRYLTTATDILRDLIQPITLKELNLSSFYSVQEVVKRICEEIFEDEPNTNGEENDPKYDRIFHNILQHSGSLEGLNFNHNYNQIPDADNFYLKFHPTTGPNFQILESCLISPHTTNPDGQMDPSQVLTLYDT